jgi:uncharacterized protein (DUF4415 family)
MSEKLTEASSTWVDPDEAPELTDEWFATAQYMIGDRVVSKAEVRAEFERAGVFPPGRPKTAHPKVAVGLRLDQRVVDHFKAAGRGWQTRVNAALVDSIAQGRA